MVPASSGGGGGGGFAAAGGNATGEPVYGGTGGDGITLTIPGSPLAVGGGGGGAGMRNNDPAPANYGSSLVV